MGARGSEHVLGRALAVHAMLAGGRSTADVQRRLGRSKGYVSVLGYLGAVVAGVEPEDLARLRVPALTPRVVWPLVTRARTEERALLRQGLGDALTDAARDEARRRARARATVQLRAALRAHAQAAAAGLTAPPKARGGRRAAPAARGPAPPVWDPAAWAADPVGYARAHLAALAAAHRTVVDAATLAARTAGAERALRLGGGAAGGAGDAAGPALTEVGSLRRISPERWRALAARARTCLTPAETEALALLGGVQAALAASASRSGVGPGAAISAAGVTSAEVDADLSD